jgi:hypothetical protein
MSNIERFKRQVSSLNSFFTEPGYKEEVLSERVVLVSDEGMQTMTFGELVSMIDNRPVTPAKLRASLPKDGDEKA